MNKNDKNFEAGEDIIFGSEEMRESAPAQFIPSHKTSAQTAYQIVKDETFPQTQPRLNLATFVTTYMDDYGTRLMNEAVGINYIDETEYPRVAVMCGRCINMVANMWNTPEKNEWKTGAVGIGSSEACRLGGVAAYNSALSDNVYAYVHCLHSYSASFLQARFRPAAAPFGTPC